MSETQSIEIDQELARKLLIEGGTLFFQNVPKKTIFGIDTKTWNTGEKFKGIKMIPPGLHFIHYSATNKYDDVVPRAGFMYNFKKSEFLVKKWNLETEDISNEVIPECEVERLKSNLLNLDPYLGVYPFDVFIKWKNLTEYITDELVARLVPLSGQIRSALELSACEKPETSRLCG
uniref:Protein AAR2 homolog n=1 Tax=Clastoptera arizonana TaxID=38151 RepID=A0A1B6CYG9_9HEMI